VHNAIWPWGGKAVGPDLSSVGREMTLPEIDEAVRQPSARIKPGYEMVLYGCARGVSSADLPQSGRYSIQIRISPASYLLVQSQIAELINDR
jgi:hypothetical protein